MLMVMVIFNVVHPSEINATLRGPGARKIEKGRFTCQMV